MLSITILCVGRLKESYWREAAAEYLKRLGAFCRPAVIEVEEARMPDNPSEAQIAAALEAEGKRLLAKVPSGATVAALCIEGRELSSVQLAETFSRWTVGGASHVVLLIGGSWGLSEEAKRAASLRLSMSPMTFPHQMARIMLLEQIYRAMQIQHGGKYHK